MDTNDEWVKFGDVSESFTDYVFEETGLGESISRQWRSVRKASQQAGEDWLEVAPPRRQYLLSVKAKVEGWKVTEPTGMLPMGRVGMLAAAGGVGKSQALAQLGMSVACGRDFLETYTVDTPGHVLLVMGEEEEEEIRRRIYYVCKGLGLTEYEKELVRDRITFLALSGTPVSLTQEQSREEIRGDTDDPSDDGRETGYSKQLRHWIEHAGHPWSLIIFDPLSRFAGPDVEVDNNAATRFIQILERFTHVTGTPTVLVAHHTSKSARQGETDAGAARGSTALSDGVRWQANLDAVPGIETEEGRLPGQLTFKVTKSNYAAFPAALTLVREANANGILRAATATERRTHREALEESLVESKAKSSEVSAKARKRAATRMNETLPASNSDGLVAPRAMLNKQNEMF